MLSYKWEVNYEAEKLFLNTKVLPFLGLCLPKCKRDTFKINEVKKLDIVNPYYCRCNVKDCRYKRNIRYYSFLKFTKTVPASIVYEILKLFILDKRNAKEIEQHLLLKMYRVPNYPTILNILENFRNYIAEYIKLNYKVKRIRASRSK